MTWNSMAKHRQALAVSALLLLALGLRLWGIGFGAHTPLARPDEESFILDALKGFHGFDGPSTLRWGWPLGHFRIANWALATERWLLAVITGQRVNLGCVYLYHPAFFSLATRLFSTAVDVLTALVVGLIARRLARAGERESAQLLGTAGYGFNYLAGREAHFGVANAAVNLGIALSVWACIKALQGRPRWLVGAGAIAGATFALKYSALPLVAPLAVAWAVLLHREPNRRASILLGLSGGLAAVLAFGVLSPEALLHPADFIQGLVGQHNRYTADGVAGYLLDPTWPRPPGWRFHFLYNLPIALGWPGYLLAVAGLVLAARQAGWNAAPLLAVEGAALVMIAPIAALFVRYADPLIPGLAVGQALMVARLAAELRLRRGPSSASAGLVVLVGLALLRPTWRLVQFDRLMARTDTRDLAQQWLVAHGGTAATLGNYTRVHLLEPSWEAACQDKLPAGWTAGTWPETPDFGPPDWGQLTADDPGSLEKVALDAVYKGTSVSRADYLFSARPVLMCGKLGRAEGSVPQNGCFELVDTISPGDPSCDSTLDMFDMFFVPYAEFEGQERPGPKVEIYRNRCKQQ